MARTPRKDGHSQVAPQLQPKRPWNHQRPHLLNLIRCTQFQHAYRPPIAVVVAGPLEAPGLWACELASPAADGAKLEVRQAQLSSAPEVTTTANTTRRHSPGCPHSFPTSQNFSLDHSDSRVYGIALAYLRSRPQLATKSSRAGRPFPSPCRTSTAT